MTKCIFNLAIILILFLSSSNAFSKERLDSYIDSRCSKGCADVKKLRLAVLKASKKYSVSKNLILSVISTESGFIKKAVNGKNVGLMQVNLRYHKPKFKGANVYNTEKNIDVGSNILSDCLIKHKQSVNKALVCYNGHGDPGYVSKIRKRLAKIKKLGN